MLKTDEVTLTGVNVGDRVRLEGEKVHGLPLEARQLEVTDRYAEPSADGDATDKREKKDNKR